MLTPIEIQSKNFKSGIGYDKKDVEAFRKDVLVSYEKIYKENVELKDKINVLNEGIQYYKTIEKTLQNALILAEKTAEETKQVALKRAKVIEKEANAHAAAIIADAKNERNQLQAIIMQLKNQYESYKVQFKQLAASQLELIDSPTYDISRLHTTLYNQSIPIDNKKSMESIEQETVTSNDTIPEQKETESSEQKETEIAEQNETESTTTNENEAFEFIDFDVKLN